MNFDRKKFFDGFRSRLDSTIEQKQVDGIEALLSCFEADTLELPQIAYAFATVFHETAGTMQPVEEAFYLGSKAAAYRKKLRYYPHYGRGYVQLTWESNYKNAAKRINALHPGITVNGKPFDLVEHPEQALTPLIAYLTLTLGLVEGWYSDNGKKLEDYISGDKRDYVGARHLVNKQDKAGLIAGYAASFEKTLTASIISAAGEQPAAGGGSSAASPDTPDPSGQQAGTTGIKPAIQPPSNGGTDGTGGTTSNGLTPEVIGQYVPKITTARRTLGLLGFGGIASTTWAAFNALPPWAVFMLGALTAVILTGLIVLVVRYKTQIIELAKTVAHINADPASNNVQLFGDERAFADYQTKLK